MEAVNMSWCNNTSSSSSSTALIASKSQLGLIRSCPNCGHKFQLQERDGGGGGGSSSDQDLPGLPAGVKFDPSDQELLEHLEGKARPELKKHQPLIDEFIPTLDGDNGICYTHPEKLPGVSRDGLIRHFFHRPSKAYTTGTRKRRKVDTDDDGGETRWHKTGKTRPVLTNGKEIKGYKKILVLYKNYGKQKKPEKTNWVMHQYHLGSNEEEKDGELVVSKVFYQTQPRQSGSGSKEADHDQMKSDVGHNLILKDDDNVVDYYSSSLMASYNQGGHDFSLHGGGPSFLP